MIAGTIELKGQRFVIVPEAEYQRMRPQSQAGLPPLPKKLKNGNYPAVSYARATLARDLILSRRRLGLSQAELARQADIASETLNRIEKGKMTASVAIVEKLDRALRNCEAA